MNENSISVREQIFRATECWERHDTVVPLVELLLWKFTLCWIYDVSYNMDYTINYTPFSITFTWLLLPGHYLNTIFYLRIDSIQFTCGHDGHCVHLWHWYNLWAKLQFNTGHYPDVSSSCIRMFRATTKSGILGTSSHKKERQKKKVWALPAANHLLTLLICPRFPR